MREVHEDPAFEYVMNRASYEAGKNGPVHLKYPRNPFALCGVRNPVGLTRHGKATCPQCLRTAAPVWAAWLRSPEYARLVGERFTGSEDA